MLYAMFLVYSVENLGLRAVCLFYIYKCMYMYCMYI